jgi:hypothetical protein
MLNDIFVEYWSNALKRWVHMDFCGECVDVLAYFFVLLSTARYITVECNFLGADYVTNNESWSAFSKSNFLFKGNHILFIYCQCSPQLIYAHTHTRIYA